MSGLNSAITRSICLYSRSISSKDTTECVLYRHDKPRSLAHVLAEHRRANPGNIRLDRSIECGSGGMIMTDEKRVLAIPGIEKITKELA